MYCDRPKSVGDGSDGSPPSEAWLFAQAILGKPIPKFVSREEQSRAEREELERLAEYSSRYADELRDMKAADAKLRHDRQILEWAAGISTVAAEKLRALQRDEAAQRERVRRAELFVDTLIEGNWDPSKHPRLGGPPNAGWWATTKGSNPRGGEAASSNKNGSYTGTKKNRPLARDPAVADDPKNVRPPASPDSAFTTQPSSGRTPGVTAASHTTSNGVPVHLVAAQSQGGHHWVSHAVTTSLESKMAKEALKVFKEGTKPPRMYNHAFDTWSGVTHGDYIGAMHDLLDNWINACGGRLEEDGAREFLSWIANGSCKRTEFAAKHKRLFATVFKWRRGFLQSIVIAHAAAELNPKLTQAELKAIAQEVVNGAPTKPLSKAAAKAAQRIIAGGKPLLKAAAKKILPGLMFFSAVMAAKRGWAGQGHTGDGAWGAFNEVTRDLMIADVVEPIVFPAVLHTVDGVTNLIAPGLNAPGRDRYIRRGGKLIDLQTGRIMD